MIPHNHLRTIFICALLGYSTFPTSHSMAAGPGWKLTFSDEFNGSSLDRTKWATRYFNSDHTEHFVIGNGTIRLRMDKALPTRAFSDLPVRISNISTQNSFAQQYGWFEVRAKCAKGSGLHSAFWLVPKDPRYNKTIAQGGIRAQENDPYEIDIFEMLGRNPFGNVYSVHAGLADRGPQHTMESYRVNTGLDLTAGFHVHAIDWTPQSVAWYLDGREVARTALSPKAPFYVLLNLYENGGWTGKVDPQMPYPKDYEIDYTGGGN